MLPSMPTAVAMRGDRAAPSTDRLSRESVDAPLPRTPAPDHAGSMTTTPTDTLAAATTTVRIRALLVTLALAPIAFLIATTIVSVVIGVAAQGNAVLIEQQTRDSVPHILLTTQLLLLGLVAWKLRRDHLTPSDIGWRRPSARSLIFGIALGAIIGIAYITVLAPAIGLLQSRLGDYVPAGEMFAAYASALPLFFVANVILAPAVEESLYRGYAVPRLNARWGAVVAIIVSSIFFGLLHWAGGAWYMLATGLVVGVPFAILSLRAKSIVPAFGAHLVLNSIEFAWVLTS